MSITLPDLNTRPGGIQIGSTVGSGAITSGSPPEYKLLIGSNMVRNARGIAFDIGNAMRPRVPASWGPSPADNPPIRSRIGTGPINPRGRRRRQSVARYRSFAECVDADASDTGVERCADEFGLPMETASALALALSRTIAAELLPTVPGFLTTGAAGVIAGGLLWPTAAGKGSDLRDLYANAVPLPGTRPAGPRRRGRRRPVPPPVAAPRPTKPLAPPKPRASSGPVTISAPRPRVLSEPLVISPGMKPELISPPASIGTQASPASSSAPGARTSAPPTAAPATIPAAPAMPSWFTKWIAPALPFLPVLPAVLTSTGVSPSLRPLASPAPLTTPQNAALTSPATAALPESDACSKARTRQRKRRKKPCKNPTVSSRVTTRKGKRYLTITKELKCPESSRKKRAWPRVR